MGDEIKNSRTILNITAAPLLLFRSRELCAVNVNGRDFFLFDYIGYPDGSV